MLRACQRLLRPGGRTAFFTIHPAAGLTAAQRRRAARDGPIAVATARPHGDLLVAAGYTHITETDATADFAAVTRAWLRHWDANYDELAALLGEAAVQERQAERRAQLRAIEDGLLARSMFIASRPCPRRPAGRRATAQAAGSRVRH